MLYPRAASIRFDRDKLIEFHCLACYENDPEWFRLDSYDEYRDEWMKTEQPASFIEALNFSIENEGGIAELWQSDSDIVGFLWLAFAEVEGYELVVAEVRDLVVAGGRGDEGIGEAMVAHAETLALEQGANLLRAGAGAANEALQTLLEGKGLDISHYSYEKVLQLEDAGEP